MNNGTMSSAQQSQAERESLMTEVQIRPPPPTGATVAKHKQPTSWLKDHLCQNRLTFGLCLSLLLAIVVVMSLLFLYALHTRLRSEREQPEDILRSATLCFAAL
jgi:hypothetical protein